MTLKKMFNSYKQYGYVLDIKYDIGDISEKTGLQKVANGEWRKPKDKLNKPFEKTSTGRVDFGRITPEQAKAIGTNTEAPIRLSLGDEYYGKIHISNEHKNQLKQHGYSNINDFVEDIANKFDEIRQGKTTATRTTFLLVKKTSKGCLYIELEKTENGNYYGINSGGYFSQRYLNKHSFHINIVFTPKTTIRVWQDLKIYSVRKQTLITKEYLKLSHSTKVAQAKQKTAIMKSH